MPRKLEKHHKNQRLGGGCNQTMEDDDSDPFSNQDHPNSRRPEEIVLQQQSQSSPDDDGPEEEEDDDDEYEDQEDDEEEEEDFRSSQLLCSPGESQTKCDSSPVKKSCTPHKASSTKSASSPSPKKSKAKGIIKGNRCQICRKKVGLTGFTCRCGGLYCALHRYSDKHDCDFDYRKLGAEEIRKNNPVIEGEKIHKI